MLWHTELRFWCAWCSPCRVVVGVSVVTANEMGRFSSSGMGVPATRHRPATSKLRVKSTYYYYYYYYIYIYTNICNNKITSFI
jgi:hypothetical protein